MFGIEIIEVVDDFVYLFNLGCFRATIRSLLEAQFSRVQVTPLTELSKTIRLKSIEVLTNKNIEAGMALSSQETWNIEIDVRTPKTIVPDLFETQVGLYSFKLARKIERIYIRKNRNLIVL